MRLAVSNIAWQPADRDRAYTVLADAGIDGLEIAPGLFFHGASDPFVPTAAEARAATDAVAAHGLRLVSMQSLLFGVQGAALFEGPEALARLEAAMGRAIALAERFGIPNLVFGSPRQRCVPDGVPMEDALARAADVFRRLGDRAAAAGTHLAMESNPAVYGTNFLTTLDEAAAFVEQVDHPAVTVILDLGAMNLNGVFDSTPARVPAIMPRLSHVHVSEPQLAPAPADAAALAPVLRALRAHGYDRAVSIEMRPPPEGIEGVAAAVDRLVAARHLAEAA